MTRGAYPGRIRRAWRSLSPATRAALRIAALTAAAVTLLLLARPPRNANTVYGATPRKGGHDPSLRSQPRRESDEAPHAPDQADPADIGTRPDDQAASEIGLVRLAVPGDPDAVTGDEEPEESVRDALPRVFVYPLPPRFNTDLLPGTDGATNPALGGAYAPHAWEAVLHRGLLAASTRVTRPRDADLFFVPVYAAAAVFASPDPHEPESRNAARHLVRDALRWVRHHYGAALRAKGGVDHIVPLAYGLGDCLEPFDAAVSTESRHEAGPADALRAALGDMTVLTSGSDAVDIGRLGAIHHDAAPVGAPTAPVRRGRCMDPSRHLAVPPVASAAALRAAGAEDMVPHTLGESEGGDDGAGAGASSAEHWQRRLTDVAAALATRWGRERAGARPRLLTFRGHTTLQRSGDPWRTARLTLGGSALRPGAETGEVPADLRPRPSPCYDDVARSANPAACAETCSWELARRRPFSKGLRPLLRHYAQFLPRNWGVSARPGRSAAADAADAAESRFCTAAQGDHLWTASLTHALLAGCVPVALADGAPLPLEADAPPGAGLQWRSAVLRVRESHFARLPFALRKWPAARRKRAQAAGADLLPSLLWVPSADHGPAAAVLRLAAARAATAATATPRFVHSASLLRLLPKPPPLPQRRRADLTVTIVNPNPEPAAGGGSAGGAGSSGNSGPLLCFMTQMTVDRAPLLRRTLESWPGVASVAVLSRDPDAEAEAMRSGLGAAMAQVRLALVRDEEWTHFPVNSLRNVALEGCPRNAPIVMLDVDFMPSRDAYARLQAYAASDTARRSAFLMPAFELEDSVVEAGRLDLDKEDIVAMTRGDGRHPRIRRSDARPFHVRNFPYGHHMTDFERWYAATEPYTVPYEYSAEPYVMVKPPVPWFDESFVAYGQNKVAWLHELAAAGFQYTVVPGVFIFHAHIESAARGSKREKDYKIGWSCWRQFLDRVEAEYGYALADPCWAAVLLKQAHEKYGLQCLTNSYARTKPYDPPWFDGSS